jgi:hypothetical protein
MKVNPLMLLRQTIPIPISITHIKRISEEESQFFNDTAGTAYNNHLA